MVVLLAPVILTTIHNHQQSRIATAYSRDVATLDQTERDALLNAAREYNQNLGDRGIQDPWLTQPDTTSQEFKHYSNLLAVDSVMARLRVPNVDINLPVYHGTDLSTLAHGVGHLYGTALPVGGAGTHSVLTGHTGLTTLTMFDNLHRIQLGDVFVVETVGQVMAYEVDQIKKVLPNQIDDIRPVAGQEYVTLVTCTPYGINSHRLLVRGTRTELPEHFSSAERSTSPWQWWMTFSVVLSVCILGYLVWWLMFVVRRKHPIAATAEVVE